MLVWFYGATLAQRCYFGSSVFIRGYGVHPWLLFFGSTPVLRFYLAKVQFGCYYGYMALLGYIGAISLPERKCFFDSSMLLKFFSYLNRFVASPVQFDVPPALLLYQAATVLHQCLSAVSVPLCYFVLTLFLRCNGITVPLLSYGT